jgi:hypothetical protein
MSASKSVGARAQRRSWTLKRMGYLEPADGDTEHLITLRNDACRKAVAHAKEFLFGSQ